MQSSTNSSTFPCMSYKPHAFAPKLPTGAVQSSHRPPHSSPKQFARLLPIASPQLYVVRVPERAAYSHSDSLRRRYDSRVFPDSHETYCLTFHKFKLITGRLPRPQPWSSPTGK